MARPTTVARVLAAVLDLAEHGGPSALTMEGIAAEAGVGKQTLYRTWPSVHAILFDALVTESAAAGSSESYATTFDVLQSTIAELTTEPRASLLRMLAAAIHSDEAIAHQFHTRLFQPQQEQITRLVVAGHEVLATGASVR
ncbi:TetR/AcrR family transcriptional regulator [Kocuria marina]|uniref:TetR/AcrR family transcriptional regulator n=1 Tax=Kocuria marina TaxID=223184 RepID=UPI003F21E7FF